MITTLIISFLFGLLCLWLLRNTKCVNTTFITPLRVLAHRVFLRKTRRGWMSFSGQGLTRLDPTRVAMNDAVADAALKDEEKDAMLRELLDLAHNATDADVRSTFSTFEQEDATEATANAKALEQRKLAANALGLKPECADDELQAAILAVPEKIRQATDLAANEKKARGKLLLDVAINSGRVLQSQRAVYETAFNSDFDGTATKLEAEGLKLNTTALQLGHRKELAANSRETEVKINEAVNAKMAADPKLTYLQAWNSVQADPQFKSFFSTSQPEVAAS